MKNRDFAVLNFRERPNQTHERVAVTDGDGNDEFLPQSELDDRDVGAAEAAPRAFEVPSRRLKRHVGKERVKLPAEEPLVGRRYGILHRDLLSC
ncbi:MAG: hypothetical protein Q8M76_17970, partial [Spirochaetaceae bacterium]|nr:hypothetical protein [Spirochaetaceae bacterium]